MFQKPITGAVNRVLATTKDCGRRGRITHNRRTIGSLSSPPSPTTTTIGTEVSTNNVWTARSRNTVVRSRNDRLEHTHLLIGAPSAWRRLCSAATHNNNSCINNLKRRSMVTITQTKSTDSAPLFSSHVVDDVSSSEPAPTYVVNEDTNLIVTESCLKQVERLLNQRREGAGDDDDESDDDGYFLRVFVDAGGCSGFQYQFEVDNELDDDEDIVVIMAKTDGDSSNTTTSSSASSMSPRVVVDETSMGFLEGSTIDYVIEMIKSAFVVTDNPQSESACGCGSSFAMKNFEKFGAKD